MTAPNNQLVVYERTKKLLRSEEVTARFREMLGEKAAGFVASVLNVVYASDHLRNADPNSIITAAFTAATLDLPVDKNLGFSWIVPYKGQAAFQMGWRGYVQLAIRTGQYLAINAAEIYEGEEIKEDRLTGRIVLNGRRTGDHVIGYVAYFKLLNGFEKFHYMTVEQVTAHAKKYSKSWGKADSAWTTNFDAMAKKTVLKALISKYGIMSIQMRTAIQYDSEEEPVNIPVSMPAFEVLDARAEEPAPAQVAPAAEPAAEEPAAAEPPADPLPSLNIPAALVAAGVVPNEETAVSVLKFCKLQAGTPIDGYAAWVKRYLAWIDLGDTTEKAAQKANQGKLPS